MDRLYVGIDLHANNNVTVVCDENDRIVFGRRLPNVLASVLGKLEPYRDAIAGVVVESTFNWYWLVDGLMEAGYRVHLANTAGIQQYTGLKYTDDNTDARWLARLLRLGLLPEGYVYPKQERAVRDLVRKRSQLVRQRTANILSIQNLVSRNTGVMLNVTRIKRLLDQDVERMLPTEDIALAVKSNLAVIGCLKEQIHILETTIKGRVRLRDEYKGLLTVSGIGMVLALTIMLETGQIGRFGQVGNYASYCRCVGSTRISNNKRKGSGNKKNGNKYLAWAFVEAANFAIRYDRKINRYYQRKMARTSPVVARKAIAHKLARACFYILRDQVPFDVNKAFA